MSQLAYFVRHVETANNLDNKFMGSLDMPCLPSALERIRLNPIVLDPAPELVFCSPLRRCVDTAIAMFGSSVQLELDDRLAERSLGVWEGVSKSAVRKRFPEAFFADGYMDAEFTPPEGEELSAFVARVSKFLQMLAVNYGPELDSRRVVVTHNGVIRIVRHLLEGQPLVETFRANEPHAVPLVIG